MWKGGSIRTIPTMTVIAEVGGNKVPNLHKYCPDIDIVGINSYAGLQNVGDRYLERVPASTGKPYIITEFGAPGAVRNTGARRNSGHFNEMYEHGKGNVVSQFVSEDGAGASRQVPGIVCVFLGRQGGSDGHVARHVSCRTAAGSPRWMRCKNFGRARRPSISARLIKNLAINGTNEVILG